MIAYRPLDLLTESGRVEERPLEAENRRTCDACGPRRCGHTDSMDLTKTAPRSAKDKLAGLVSLKRSIDKAKAFNEGHLGEYDYDCPHDKPLFAFLGVDAETFAKKVGELQSDDAIVAWLQSTGTLSKKTPAEIDAFNAERTRWRPDPGSHGEEYFLHLRNQIAPDRTDVVTWFDILDLDEKRPVPVATKAS
jgi:hypothetical protein